MRTVPSYGTGLARFAAESQYPEQWRGLIGAWAPALGPTGLTLYDQSGHGNHGTLTNMEVAADWIAKADRWGHPGYALNFDGSNESVVCPAGTILDRTGTISIYARFQFTGNPTGYDWLISNGLNGGNFGYSIILGFNTPQIAWGDAAGFIKTSTVYNLNQWYDLVCTYNDNGAFSGLAIYVDGVKQATSNVGAFTGFSLTTRRFTIGCHDSSGSLTAHSKALVNSVLVYDRALNANEIISLYENPYGLYQRKPPAVALASSSSSLSSLSSSSSLSVSSSTSLSSVSSSSKFQTMELTDGVSAIGFSPQINPGINRPDQRNRGVHQYDGGIRQYWDTGGGRRDTFTLRNISKTDADKLNQWWRDLTILEYRGDAAGNPTDFVYSRLNPAGSRPFQFTFGQTVDTNFEAVVTIPQVSSSSSA